MSDMNFDFCFQDILGHSARLLSAGSSDRGSAYDDLLGVDEVSDVSI